MHRKNALTFLRANSECFRVSADIAPNTCAGAVLKLRLHAVRLLFCIFAKNDHAKKETYQNGAESRQNSC
jgi:hypothetical protein